MTPSGPRYYAGIGFIGNETSKSSRLWVVLVGGALIIGVLIGWMMTGHSEPAWIHVTSTRDSISVHLNLEDSGYKTPALIRVEAGEILLITLNAPGSEVQPPKSA